MHSLNKMDETTRFVGSEGAGGWSFDFVETVDNEYLCPICLLPMKDPVQVSSCGHLFCSFCIKQVLHG